MTNTKTSAVSQSFTFVRRNTHNCYVRVTTTLPQLHCYVRVTITLSPLHVSQKSETGVYVNTAKKLLVPQKAGNLGK
jgi:hypothetical protein